MSGAEKMIQMMNEILLENRCFEFLDELRETGAINMFGASPYLAEAFGLDKKKATDIVMKWMQTFNERHPQE